MKHGRYVCYVCVMYVNKKKPSKQKGNKNKAHRQATGDLSAKPFIFGICAERLK